MTHDVSLPARERLLRWFHDLDSCLVAFSGGVDSSVVAKAAVLALGEKSFAVTAKSPSVAERDLRIAQETAEAIGIRHEVIQTAELDRPGYVANASDRCLHCKSELYDHLTAIRSHFQTTVIVNGANLDDRGDHRPGMIAAANAGVRSPLLECEIDKNTLREIAKEWDIPVWDRPASPCLASRIAYGVQVTPERLKMVELAEDTLRSLGLRDLRVRYHDGDLARLEVPIESIEWIAKPENRETLERQLTEIGFKFVTLDLGGLKSGSLNQLIQVSIDNS
ncbi:ATP-dependent sacrificial sulfur transferase LarE [Blastopirellula marina]|uniref:ATP-dependent sacrificial sulfur transferase LarE n=1 Tax=Blastopirellula marina TaxID=124 RepID=A0A2S8FAK5_9BACT|nr:MULTISPECIES: ATP-dependent sacrificial sulfur transferase LarE [Pirellulaceae]PQO29179.1 ATP-dependent sacrificial sulfur transferase LarE [Blastopirellula marina]RCS50372.1 ATP-dependent sacrificial sulfur transferase LarE [Bremerella cremea]